MVVSGGRLVVCGTAAHNGRPAFPLNAFQTEEEIELSEFWCFVESNLPLIAVLLSLGTFFGIAVSALVNLLHYCNTKRYNLPTVSTTLHLHDDVPHMIFFSVEESEPKWLVTGVRIRGRRHRLLAKAIGAKKDPWGHYAEFEAAGPWFRHIRFDPPVENEHFLLHDDAPKDLLICFDVCLRSSPRTRRSVPVRLFTSD